MPRILDGSEFEDAIRWMDEAVRVSCGSPCKRDQRGVVIVSDGNIIGAGVNSPPLGFECCPKYCEPTCKGYAVHAEMNAIIGVGNKELLRGTRMYHARSENGVLVNSRKPRCVDCAKHILAFGIPEFVLKHEEGYSLYSAHEFFRMSLENQNKK
jgi:deoxycytidylate deaminase